MAHFVVSDEVFRLMNLLDGMRNGALRRIEVRAGIPRRILESQVLNAPPQ